MGAVDVERQKPNVFRMKLLGAKVNAVTSRRADAEGRHERGAARLGRQRARHLLHHRHGGGPASLSGHGARLPVASSATRCASRCWRRKGGCPTRSSPASAAAPTPSACSIRSSTTRAWRSTAWRPAGHGLEVPNGHAASMNGGRPGVLHGNRTYLLQDADGQILEGHSISAGLDYPGVGPEHAWLKDIGPRHLCLGHRQGGARGLPAVHASSRASFRRWSRRTRWPSSQAGADACRKRQPAGHEHVRPRRQGHLRRRRASGHEDVSRRCQRRELSLHPSPDKACKNVAGVAKGTLAQGRPAPTGRRSSPRSRPVREVDLGGVRMSDRSYNSSAAVELGGANRICKAVAVV